MGSDVRKHEKALHSRIYPSKQIILHCCIRCDTINTFYHVVLHIFVLGWRNGSAESRSCGCGHKWKLAPLTALHPLHSSLPPYLANNLIQYHSDHHVYVYNTQKSNRCRSTRQQSALLHRPSRHHLTTQIHCSTSSTNIKEMLP